MTRLTMTAGLAALVAIASVPDLSQARTHYYRHTHYQHTYRYRSDCWGAHHRAANTGTVVGAIAGGVLGSQIAGRGNRTAGTLIGGGVGAVAGHHVGAHSHRCR